MALVPPEAVVGVAVAEFGLLRSSCGVDVTETVCGASDDNGGS